MRILENMLSEITTICEFGIMGNVDFHMDEQRIVFSINHLNMFTLHKTDSTYVLAHAESETEESHNERHIIRASALGDAITELLQNTFNQIYLKEDTTDLSGFINFDEVLTLFEEEGFEYNKNIKPLGYSAPKVGFLAGIVITPDPEAKGWMLQVVDKDEHEEVVAQALREGLLDQDELETE